LVECKWKDNNKPVQKGEIEKGDELLALCISEGRSEKDKAIREFHEKKLLADS